MLQTTELTNSLQSAGRLVGSRMNRDAGRLLGKKARGALQAALSISSCRDDREARVFGIAGTIMDDMTRAGFSTGEITVVAEAFGDMRPTCEPSKDLMFFSAGLFGTTGKPSNSVADVSHELAAD